MSAGGSGVAIVISGAVIIGCLWVIGRVFDSNRRNRKR